MLRLIAVVALGASLSAAASEPWTLERALSHTLANSPDARLARQRIVAAKAALDQAKAAFWPQVQVQSSYMGSDNPMLVFGSILNQEAFSPSLDFNRVPDVDNLNVKGLVTAPLYTGGQMASRRKAARANSQATEFEAEAVRNALAFEVARAFHTIHKARAFIATYRDPVVGKFTFPELLSLLMFLFSAAGGVLMVIFGGLTAELKGAIVTLMLIGGHNKVAEFWFGSSFGSRQKDQPK